MATSELAKSQDALAERHRTNLPEPEWQTGRNVPSIRESSAEQATLSYLPKGGSPDQCSICGCITKRLVRDHCHKTGMIRGLLCQLCNSWLGVYEANLRRKIKRGRGRFKAWEKKFQASINEHLKKNTGISYRSGATNYL